MVFYFCNTWIFSVTSSVSGKILFFRLEWGHRALPSAGEAPGAIHRSYRMRWGLNYQPTLQHKAASVKPKDEDKWMLILILRLQQSQHWPIWVCPLDFGMDGCSSCVCPVDKVFSPSYSCFCRSARLRQIMQTYCSLHGLHGLTLLQYAHPQIFSAHYLIEHGCSSVRVGAGWYLSRIWTRHAKSELEIADWELWAWPGREVDPVRKMQPQKGHVAA